MQENVPLMPLTWFKIGGPARYFARPTTLVELQDALQEAKKHVYPVFVLGGGSNLIVSDAGFNGLVIHPMLNSVNIDGTSISCGAATDMPSLVDATASRGLKGLEWAGGLPGFVGGAIRGNAGAFKGEIKDVVATVQSVTMNGAIRRRNNAECEFSYRESIFKRNPEIIVQARLKLEKGDAQELQAIAEQHRAYRQERHPLEYPNVGSIFKNTPVEHVPNEHRARFTDVVKDDPFPVVPTAAIIAATNIQGFRVGGAELSHKHTNFIVNRGHATARDVLTVIKHIKQTVRAKFEITLEVEPELVGFSTEELQGVID